MGIGIIIRNFDHHGRPSFDNISAMLQALQDDPDLLDVPQVDADKTANPTAVKQLGGKLELAVDLYRDLQGFYVQC